MKNIFIDIDIDKAILENIDLDIEKGILQNIDIERAILKNIDIEIDIDKEILENTDIDIDKEILENIDIDKISNRLEFGILNRAMIVITTTMMMTMITVIRWGVLTEKPDWVFGAEMVACKGRSQFPSSPSFIIFIFSS